MIAIYTTVSTDARVEAGLVSQLAELRRFAGEKYAGEVLVEFIDAGYTGADLERPGELIRRTDFPVHDRPAKQTIKVCFVDTDPNGGPGPNYLAYQRRMQGAIAGGRHCI